jgi:hypothetical protein
MSHNEEKLTAFEAELQAIALQPVHIEPAQFYFAVGQASAESAAVKQLKSRLNYWRNLQIMTSISLFITTTVLFLSSQILETKVVKQSPLETTHPVEQIAITAPHMQAGLTYFSQRNHVLQFGIDHEFAVINISESETALPNAATPNMRQFFENELNNSL